MAKRRCLGPVQTLACHLCLQSGLCLVKLNFDSGLLMLKCFFFVKEVSHGPQNQEEH